MLHACVRIFDVICTVQNFLGTKHGLNLSENLNYTVAKIYDNFINPKYRLNFVKFARTRYTCAHSSEYVYVNFYICTHSVRLAVADGWC